MIKKVRLIPLFFSALGLIVTVEGIILNDWEGTIWGAVTAIALFPDVLLVKHLRNRVLHRLSIFVAVLGYCVLGYSHLWGVLMLIAGVVALLDGIHLIARRKSLGESSTV